MYYVIDGGRLSLEAMEEFLFSETEESGEEVYFAEARAKTKQCTARLPFPFLSVALSAEMITGSAVRWASASTGIVFIRVRLRLAADRTKWWGLAARIVSNGVSHRRFFCRLHFSSGSASVCWTSLLVNPPPPSHHHFHTPLRH